MKTKFIGGKKYYYQWLSPNFDLNNRNVIISGLTQYQGNSVGISPYFMLQDNSIINNNYEDGLLHVLLTDSIKNNNYENGPDVKNFLDTPWCGLNSYKKLIKPDIHPLGSPLTFHIIYGLRKGFF